LKPPVEREDVSEHLSQRAESLGGGDVLLLRMIGEFPGEVPQPLHGIAELRGTQLFPVDAEGLRVRTAPERVDAADDAVELRRTVLDRQLPLTEQLGDMLTLLGVNHVEAHVSPLP